MDGNLLDPDNADATLAKEWSLPELPAEKSSSSLPGSSRELAEIFGGSDDEDMEFPFSLGVGKTLPDLSLPDGRVSDFFLKSIDSLSAPVSMESALVSMEGTAEKEVSAESGKVAAGGEKGSEIEKDAGSKKDEGDDKVKESAKAMDDTGSVSESADSATVGKKVEGMTLRKSARLGRNVPPINTTRPKKEPQEVEAVKKEDIKSEQKIGSTEGDATTPIDDSNRKSPEKAPEGLPEVKGMEEVPVKKEEEKEKEKGVKQEVKEEEEEEEEDDDDKESDGEDSESDDPDRLWCICHKPHDDRFMICCDLCEEWYHGSCVGISVSQGKRMEREGKEYTCPICVERERQAREQREMSRSARIGRRDVIKEKDMKKKLDGSGVGVARRRSSSGVAGTPEDADYGLSQLFQPDNAPKMEPGAEVAEDAMVRSKFKVEYTGTCIYSDCTTPTAPPSVYCGEACVERHASDSLKMLSDRGISFHSNPSDFVRGSGGVSVIEKATGKMLVGIAAPSERNLIPWLKEHPSFQVLLHKKRKHGASKKPKAKPGVKKEPDSTSSFPKIALMDPTSVRANAKKALYQIIWKRCEDAEDMKNLEQNKVEAIANDVEEKLFNLHQDINPKYKNKYRSLVFNLKDTKNQGLFRKVVTSEVSPYELVRMSTGKLASDELAQWREKTIKKNLEMIKVREEEAGTVGKVIRKFTYKGEVEIDMADDSKIEPMEAKEDPTSSKEPAPPSSAAGSKQNSTSKQDSGSKSATSKKLNSDSKSKTKSGGILDLIGDAVPSSSDSNTTSLHGSHVYDQHCDICTGKVSSSSSSSSSLTSSLTSSLMTPPTSSDSPPHASSTPSPPQHSPEPELMDTDSEHLDAEVPAVSANHVVWKGFVNMSGLAKFATTAYPVSGRVDNLNELLPDTLHVMGRIAHVQVWDYMDKLRSSTTRDTVVLRFSCSDEEMDSYASMLTYLVKKHRCGVINCCFPGMKDMYLVPLQASSPIAQQLLPFDGPGLSDDRGDILLGLIVRSKAHRARLDPQSPMSTQKISAEVCIKRHHSLSLEEVAPPSKRARMVVEVGVRGETPPRSGGFQDDDYQDSTTPIFNEANGDGAKESDPLKAKGSEKNLLSPPSSAGHVPAQMSFYGEHRPLPEPKPKASLSPPPPPPPAAAAAATPTPPSIAGAASLTLSGSGDISSILSQISDEKLLKDLASAVSSLNKPTAPVVPTSSNTSTSPKSTPDYGANTPPPEEVLLADRKPGSNPRSLSRHLLPPPQEKLPRVAGGPPFPQVAGGPPFPQQMEMAAPPQQKAVAAPQQAPPPHYGAPPPNTNHRGQGRERFANTPPPEFQPTFIYPQQQPPQQQPPYQYQNNYNKETGRPYQTPPPPQQQLPQPQNRAPQDYYSKNTNYQQPPPPPAPHGGDYPPRRQQQDWDYSRRKQEHPTNHDPRLRGESGRGYRHHHEQRDRDDGKGRKYPSEWYRD